MNCAKLGAQSVPTDLSVPPVRIKITSCKPNFCLLRRAEQQGTTTDVVEAFSELSKSMKLNGGFRKNYGTLLGAFLYLLG